jgi:acetylornithine deacetylase/succinyl-diaminopimelate desuccinylase-like protein
MVQNPADNLEMARLVGLAQTLVCISSIINHEHEIADWAYEHLRSIGLTQGQRLPVQDSGDTIIGWIAGPAQGPVLMFNFHLDTFPVCDGWSSDLFVPHHLEDGRLYDIDSLPVIARTCVHTAIDLLGIRT